VETAKKEWKQAVQSKITGALTEVVEDVDLIDFTILKTALRRMVNNLELPELNLSEFSFSARHEKANSEAQTYSPWTPLRSKTHSYTGTLEGSEAEKFMDTIQTYLGELRAYYCKQTSDFIAGLEKSAKRERMSELIFSDLQKQIETLEKELGNKKLTLDRLEKFQTALKESS
jgi:predicted RNase H-like nuclease (RuvC/YqgF family)